MKKRYNLQLLFLLLFRKTIVSCFTWDPRHEVSGKSLSRIRDIEIFGILKIFIQCDMFYIICCCISLVITWFGMVKSRLIYKHVFFLHVSNNGGYLDPSIDHRWHLAWCRKATYWSSLRHKFVFRKCYKIMNKTWKFAEYLKKKTVTIRETECTTYYFVLLQIVYYTLTFISV